MKGNFEGIALCSAGALNVQLQDMGGHECTGFVYGIHKQVQCEFGAVLGAHWMVWDPVILGLARSVGELD